jgi:DNA-binding beta-propeller fold protein YncE
MKAPVLALLIVAMIPGSVMSQSCEVQVLISDFNGNEVHVFDGCNGQFLKNLDNAARLSGPQALRLGPDNRIYVASEQNNRVVRYNADTLAFVDIFIDNDLGGISAPTGLAFGPDGDLYVAGFDTDNVGRFDGQSGNFKSIFASGTLSGPDAGMIFGPDGHLYVPSFNNHLVARFNGTTGALIDTLEVPGFDGMRSPRTVLFSDDGQRMLVSSWGNNRVLEFSPDGELLATLGIVNRPTGIDFGANGQLLVASDQGGLVASLDALTGTTNPPFVAAEGSQIQAGTFVLVLGETSMPAAQTSNEQFWIVGAGPIDNNQLTVNQAVSTSDGRFGDALDPGAVQRPPWGEVEVEIIACDQAELRWSSLDQSFGDGGYSLIRLAPTPAQTACENEGFANTSNMDWIVGAWFGGAEHDGEGLLIDVLDGGVGFIAWFSYTP